MSEENEVPPDQMQSELDKTVKKYDEALKGMENEAPSAEKVARSIIYKDDFFKKYSEIVPEVGERLERYVFDIRDALSALRASWEREKAELVKEYQRLQDKGLEKFSKETPQDMVIVRGPDMAKILAEKQALEAEKKGLEEREHIAGCYEVYGDCTCKDLHERVVEEMKQESLRHLKYLSDANIEITRLKAENERLLTSQTATFLNGFRDEVTSMAKTIHKQEEKIDSLTLALAEARDSLEGVIRVADRETVEFQVARKALTNPTSQRASEEMVGLREEVNEARSILNLLGFHYWPKQKEIDAYLEEMKGLRKVVEEAKKVTNIASPIYGCDLRGLKDALEAYESRGKV